MEEIMKVCKLIFALTATASFAAASGQTPISPRTPAAASAPTVIPALVPFSGIAIASDGKLLTGEASITFILYKDEAGGEPLWTESQSAAVDSTGHYKVQLGASSPNGLPSDLFSTGEVRWLEIQIAGQTPQPRVLLASVPYAMKAADAATLGGLPASAFVLAGSKPAAGLAVADVVTPDASSTVTTPGGTSGYLPVFSGTASITDSILFQNSLGIGIGDVPNGMLDVNGKSIFRGPLQVARIGNATSSTGVNSNPFAFYAQAYNSSTKQNVGPFFEIQAEPTGNNTSAPGATLHLLYDNGTAANPTESGFYFNANGTMHFASGQTFPGVGPGTITGVTAGTDLTGGGTSGDVTLKLDTTKVPTLAGNNNFTGSNVFVPSIYEDTDVNIDNNNTNSGGVSPGLRFGQASGEAIASQRASSGDNQYGLDFFTNYTRRISISENGYIGIGRASAEGTMLDVSGGSYAGEFTNNEQDFPALFAQNLTTADALVFETYGSGGVCDIDTNANLACEGTVSGGDLVRKIDDPQDAANKYLVHAAVQSSELMNIYSGNVTTDELGVATVTLPSWFEAENADFRYQLTTIGRDAHAWVSQELANGQFKISTNATNVKVSWQITAVRQDSYAKANPLVAEQVKPVSERGLYQHPELFGQPKEKGIAWAHQPELMKKSKAPLTTVSHKPVVR
jgi:hypothetical protein